MTPHDKALEALRHRYRMNVTSTKFNGDEMKIRGWLTPPSGHLGCQVIGADVVDIEYGQIRNVLGDLFGAAHFAKSGLEATLKVWDGGSLSCPGYVLLGPALPANLIETRIANTWAIPIGSGMCDIPPDGNVTRVTGGGTSSSYLFGGATHAYRMIQALELLSGLSSFRFHRVVDWGCGAGRLSQHFLRLWPNLTGIDVDLTNVEWCRQNIPQMKAIQIPWEPPTEIAGDRFDLLLAFSVFSHIHHARLHVWLDEIRRILTPGGFAVVTTLGRVSTASRKAPPEFFYMLEEKGFVEWANKGQLDDARPDPDAYLNIAMTQEYARSVFRKHFRVAGVLEGLAPQDAWVLQKV